MKNEELNTHAERYVDRKRGGATGLVDTKTGQFIPDANQVTYSAEKKPDKKYVFGSLVEVNPLYIDFQTDGTPKE